MPHGKIRYQTNARIQQNSGAATAVLLKFNGRLHDALSAFDSREEAIINPQVDVKKEG